MPTTTTPPKRVIGAGLRALRERHGLNQKAIAARLGVNQASVSRVENVRTDSTVGTVTAYCRAVGASSVALAVTFPDGSTDRVEITADEPESLVAPIGAEPAVTDNR